MEVIVSSKYQVVIPKAVRKQLGLKPGQKVQVSQKAGTINIDTVSVVEKYAGSLTSVWGNIDPAVQLRADRDASDRGDSGDRRN